jgi:hypothetical protein
VVAQPSSDFFRALSRSWYVLILRSLSETLFKGGNSLWADAASDGSLPALETHFHRETSYYWCPGAAGRQLGMGRWRPSQVNDLARRGPLTSGVAWSAHSWKVIIGEDLVFFAPKS